MTLIDNPDLALPKGSLILVTGASGYIAGNFIVEALDAGYKIRGTVRSASKAQRTKEVFDSPNYDALVVADIEQEGAFDDAVKGVDAIVHMASPLTLSPNPKEVVAPAVNGATFILQSAIKEPSVKRFVLTSSSTATSLPKPGVKFKIDQNTWNTEVDDYVDFPPPYLPENAMKVYAASKTKAEQAVWEFVREEKPRFVVNCVNPAYNMGRVVDSPGATGQTILKAFKGEVAWGFPPQYMINVVDCARLHLAALIDGSVKNERILAFGTPFNWNDVLDNFRHLFPDRKFVDNQQQQVDLSEVDNGLGQELLRKWFGQDGYTGLKESLRQNVSSVV